MGKKRKGKRKELRLTELLKLAKDTYDELDKKGERPECVKEFKREVFARPHPF
jgi:hypothetical protein